jgi:hypothetical protein
MTTNNIPYPCDFSFFSRVLNFWNNFRSCALKRQICWRLQIWFSVHVYHEPSIQSYLRRVSGLIMHRNGCHIAWQVWLYHNSLKQYYCDIVRTIDTLFLYKYIFHYKYVASAVIFFKWGKRIAKSVRNGEKTCWWWRWWWWYSVSG